MALLRWRCAFACGDKRLAGMPEGAWGVEKDNDIIHIFLSRICIIMCNMPNGKIEFTYYSV